MHVRYTSREARARVRRGHTHVVDLADGCPDGCHSHGQCVRDGERWRCACLAGWAGRDCSVPQETQCSDKADNDKDGLVDCADSECCYRPECSESLLCLSSPEPQDILLRKQPPAVTASFYQRMKFLIEEDSVQSYSHRDEYSERSVRERPSVCLVPVVVTRSLCVCPCVLCAAARRQRAAP